MDSGYSLFDLAITGLAAFFLVRGLLRGLIGEVAGLVGVALGLVAAGRFQAAALPLVSQAVTHPGWARIVAYVAVFLAAWLAVGLAARVVRRLIDLAFAGWLDHLLGGAVGFAKGAVLAMLVFLLADTFLRDTPLLTSSRLAPFLQAHAGQFKELVFDLKDLAMPAVNASLPPAPRPDNATPPGGKP